MMFLGHPRHYSAGPLHYAAQRGYKCIAELLIAGGADVNAQDMVSETPLHHAVRWGYKDLVELLVANGADISLKSQKGLNASGIAEEMEYPGLVGLLREHVTKK